MNTIFLNSDNNIFLKHFLIFQINQNLKRSGKSASLSNLSIYVTWKNIKKSYKNNKFKISAPTWNDKLELPDKSYVDIRYSRYIRYPRLFQVCHQNT